MGSEVADDDRQRLFRTTRWSLVGEAAADAGSSLEVLCRQYWQPVYAVVRGAGNDVETAKDLTQGFFAMLLERGSLASAHGICWRKMRGGIGSMICCSNPLKNSAGSSASPSAGPPLRSRRVFSGTSATPARSARATSAPRAGFAAFEIRCRTFDVPPPGSCGAACHASAIRNRYRRRVCHAVQEDFRNLYWSIPPPAVSGQRRPTG